MKRFVAPALDQLARQALISLHPVKNLTPVCLQLPFSTIWASCRLLLLMLVQKKLQLQTRSASTSHWTAHSVVYAQLSRPSYLAISMPSQARIIIFSSQTLVFLAMAFLTTTHLLLWRRLPHRRFLVPAKNHTQSLLALERWRHG